MEDYDLLTILKKSYPDTAQNIVDNIIQTATSYTKSGTTFTLDLKGNKTASNPDDFWDGMTFGSNRSYCTVWNAGGCMLLVRSTGKVDLLTSKGEVANGWYIGDTTKGRHFYTMDKGYEASMYECFESLFLNENATFMKKLSADEAPKGELVAMSYPPVKVKKIYDAIGVKSAENDAYIFDLGQNMSGLFEIYVRGNKGDKIKITPVEKLTDDGEIDKSCNTWSEYTLKRTGGIEIISSYVFWLHHEENEGVFNWERNDNVIGNDLMSMPQNKNTIETDCLVTPFLTCELGGGNQVTYHRRPIINSMDISTLALTMLGNGCNMIGYYMYHGGTNPIANNYTTQESRDTGYANDYPLVSYDFQSPLGDFGQFR